MLFPLDTADLLWINSSCGQLVSFVQNSLPLGMPTQTIEENPPHILFKKASAFLDRIERVPAVDLAE